PPLSWRNESMVRIMASLAMLGTVPLLLTGTIPVKAGQHEQKKPAGTELDPRLAPVKDLLHLLLIQPNNTGNVVPLTAQDAEALPKACPSIMAAAPVIRARDHMSHGKRKCARFHLRYFARLSGGTRLAETRGWSTVHEQGCGRPSG